MIHQSNKQKSQFFLASSSPRRRELLMQLGLGFEILEQNADESIFPNELAKPYVLRLSQSKAEAGMTLLPEAESRPVMGADTIVVIDDLILGKPTGEEHCHEMLTQLSGKTHHVLTAVTLSNRSKSLSVVSSTSVKFREISAEEIKHYWNSGEPKGKAGAYAIQGLGAIFVKRIEGSYTGVVGLPLLETSELLAEFEIAVFD